MYVLRSKKNIYASSISFLTILKSITGKNWILILWQNLSVLANIIFSGCLNNILELHLVNIWFSTVSGSLKSCCVTRIFQLQTLLCNRVSPASQPLTVFSNNIKSAVLLNTDCTVSLQNFKGLPRRSLFYYSISGMDSSCIAP